MEHFALNWPHPHGYLDTASYGIPSHSTTQAIESVLREWSEGSGVWEDWQSFTNQARESFAQLMSVPPSSVSVGSALSQVFAPIAQSLEPGDLVVVPELEFTSNLFPWLVQQERKVQVKTVPLGEFLDTVASGCTLAAISVVQSSTGEVVDLAGFAEAARLGGALTVLDATQAAGWYPIDASKFDAVGTAGYKWMCSPRGVAYLSTTQRMRARMSPDAAGWFAGEDVFDSLYGGPLRLASDARRFDISPAWFSWIGAVQANREIAQLGIDRIFQHNRSLAMAFTQELGLPDRGSAIVSVRLNEGVEAASLGLRSSMRNGGTRLSFHLYNDENDVQMAVDALKGKVSVA